ncbi:MAG: hypothetical protein H6826_03180 [Planctomycetes bacterium]|nr:hypothetical protein [Planctomycetota bacterium]
MRSARRLALFLVVVAAGAPADARERKEGPEPRYPASFRQAIGEAIERGVARLRALQAPEGHWGNPEDVHGVGHTALPMLALLKAGVPPDDEAVVRAREAIATMKVTSVYSTGCWMMALHALYAPHLDGMDTDVGEDRSSRSDPDAIHARLTEADRKELEKGLAYLLKAQNARGLWLYHIPEVATSRAFDLSNTQYAILGLRAAADCGLDVPVDAWRSALQGLLDIQDLDGEPTKLQRREVRDGYVFSDSEKAKARPFRYKDDRADGPLGEKTVPTQIASGSMTTAGVACVAMCMEGLWRSRRFSGRDRKRAQAAIRDGLAWLQENFSVTENPGREAAHHRYYLYGLERMGMLVGMRWIGGHDWYEEGARWWLDTQGPLEGGWGNHVRTAFGILFLKRATLRAVAVTK